MWEVACLAAHVHLVSIPALREAEGVGVHKLVVLGDDVLAAGVLIERPHAQRPSFLGDGGHRFGVAEGANAGLLGRRSGGLRSFRSPTSEGTPKSAHY